MDSLAEVLELLGDPGAYPHAGFDPVAGVAHLFDQRFWDKNAGHILVEEPGHGG